MFKLHTHIHWHWWWNPSQAITGQSLIPEYWIEEMISAHVSVSFDFCVLGPLPYTKKHIEAAVAVIWSYRDKIELTWIEWSFTNNVTSMKLSKIINTTASPTQNSAQIE